MSSVFTDPIPEPPPSDVGGSLAILDILWSVILPSIAFIGLAVLLWKIGTTSRRGGTFRPRGSLTVEAIGGVGVTCVAASWNLLLAAAARMADIRGQRVNFVDVIPDPGLAAIIVAPAVLGAAVGVIALRRKQKSTHAGRLEPKSDLV